MQIEDLKTWHWVIVGLLVGGLFSAVRAWQGPAFANSAADTIEVGEFESKVYAGTSLAGYERTGWLINQYHKGMPVLKDVIVHPPLADDPAKRFWITGKSYWISRRAVDPSKVGSPQQLMEGWKGFKFAAATPYVTGTTMEKQKLQKELNERQTQLKESGGKNLRLMAEIAGKTAEINRLASSEKSLGGLESFPSAVDFMRRVKAMPGSTLSYSYAWYELPAAIYSLPPLAGLLIIGCAWPLTLSVMQNFGMAKPPTVKKVKPVPAPKPVKAMSIPATASTGVVFKPVVTAPPSPPDEGDQNEYRGEFYPVVKATHKE
jgi:hypothetical protein